MKGPHGAGKGKAQVRQVVVGVRFGKAVQVHAHQRRGREIVRSFFYGFARAAVLR